MESPSLDKRLIDALVTVVANRFREVGGDVEIVEAVKAGNHLVARFEGSGERVMLLGHTDTVWPAGEIQKRPFAVEGGRATGPGAFDMKAGIVLMWMIMHVIKRSPVTVLLTSDEEIGSTSSRDLIESEANKCGAVLVLEPSLPGGVLKTSRKGVGRFTVKAIGRASHAGIAPEQGINAVEEIARQILRLHHLTAAEHGTTVTVGQVRGGTATNVVPAEAAAEVDVRVSSMHEAQRIWAAINGLSPEVPGARLEIHGSIKRPPMERTRDTVRLFEIARSVGRELGIDVKEGATGGASDGNFTAALGIPTLDGLGAVGDGAHAVHEWVDVHSLPVRAALVAGIIETLSAN